MAYKITEENYDKSTNLWKADLEASAALFALKVAEHRKKDALKVCHELNYMFIVKKITTEYKNCAPTMMQRNIIKQSGY